MEEFAGLLAAVAEEAAAKAATPEPPAAGERGNCISIMVNVPDDWCVDS